MTTRPASRRRGRHGVACGLLAGLLVSGLAACASSSVRVASVSPTSTSQILTLAPEPTSAAETTQAESLHTVVVTAPPFSLATTAAIQSTVVDARAATSSPQATESPIATSRPPRGTTTPPPVIATVQPAASVATSLAAARQTGQCHAPSTPLTAPDGRHVLLRAQGLTSASPVVFIIHGYTGTPTGIEKFAEFTSLANSNGVAVAYPQGTPIAKGGFGWDSGAGLFATTGVDDVAALSDMIDAIVATGCVDETRMTITGESNGAGMALAAVCDHRLAGRFRSLVMVIPAVDEGVLANCRNGSPSIPLTVVAGRMDATVPYVAGRPPLLPPQTWFAEAASTLNGCSPQLQPAEAITPHADLLKPSGCGTCSELIAIDDGVHTWPGTSKGTGGLRPGTYDLDHPLLRLAVGEPGCIVRT